MPLPLQLSRVSAAVTIGREDRLTRRPALSVLSAAVLGEESAGSAGVRHLGAAAAERAAATGAASHRTQHRRRREYCSV